ncbi:hypothetical protein [Microbacterium sp.]|uniref:hypothetical protein n=1 Tax=Microbacterium sp. TaxID=51671 RepID=UPI002BB43E4E|nr:hypothetical protein [Microbacterium sp.]HWL76779.1 hypothetical protein [Microbacterium sp.]
MTDARLPGYWLTELRFMDMSDRLWRIFTNALMWCAEQGTDGAVQSRHYRFLYSDGVTEDDIDSLVVAELAERTDDGFQLQGWADDRGLRQSSAATVHAYRERKRKNQAKYREGLRSRLESGDVTGHVAEHVGVGPQEVNSVKGASAYVTGNADLRLDAKKVDPTVCAKHPDGDAGVSCWGCKTAREARAASEPKKIAFDPAEVFCAKGNHKWLADGTCNYCPEKRRVVPKNEEWMYR